MTLYYTVCAIFMLIWLVTGVKITRAGETNYSLIPSLTGTLLFAAIAILSYTKAWWS